MNYRNAKFTANGDIDMEVQHPTFGWIPFTASENDVERHGRDLFNAAKTSAAAYSAPLESLTAAKARVSSEIDAARDQLIGAGLQYSFPDTTGTIQLRKEADFRNVQGVASTGQALIMAGDTTTTISFRDEENVNHSLTGSQAVQLGLAVSGFVSAHYAAAWAHKDAVAELSTAADVQQYNYSINWPS